VELVPDDFYFVRSYGAPLNKASKMLFNHKRADLAGGGNAEPDGPIARFDLNDKRAEDIDAEALSGLAILWILAHRRGDMIVKPMTASLVVVVRPAAAHSVGSDVFYCRCHTARPLVCGAPAGDIQYGAGCERTLFARKPADQGRNFPRLDK